MEQESFTADSITDTSKRFDSNELISGLTSLLKTPVSALEQLRSEGGSVRELYEKYVLALVLIPAVCSFIGLSLLGPIPVGSGIGGLILRAVFGLGGAYLLMLLVQTLAPHFGGTSAQTDALKWIIAGSFISAAAGALDILRFLPLVGYVVTAIQIVAFFYALYVLWLGLSILLGITGSRRIVFSLSLIGCLFLIGLVLSFLGIGTIIGMA